MSSEIAVQCRGVHKEFGNGAGKVLALRGVDVDARYGAMTLLVGPSGCGKTTLLSVIAGLLNSNGGEVKVLGEQIERLPGRANTFPQKESRLRFPAIQPAACAHGG